ncbi:MAG: phage tail tape measure protein, partial [Actinomycetota bacterium]|nr:phage tail tape measure protein [Actinomycetota bacterium]
MGRSGVRIAIASDFDPRGFIAAEGRSDKFRERQLANSNTVGGAWVKAGQGIQVVGQRIGDVSRTAVHTGDAMTRGLTLPIIGIGGAAVATAVSFESAFAGVEKTVDGTAEQMAGLEQGIRDMAKELPTSREEIAGVAEAAGQLGIQTENVLSFTRTMVDLGEATNLGATEGATALARFANVTGMSQDKFDQLGSSIVALGNNMATTESEIVDMSLRIAGAGVQVGMTEHQTLALATALSSVGIEAAAGGTAISKTMIGIEAAVQKGGEEVELFAQTAGMGADEFVEAWQTDPAKALNSVVVGLGNMEAQGGSTLKQLELLGITEVRQRDALLRAAGAGDLLAKALRISGDAWEEGGALADEAAKRYETTEAQLRILKNQVTDVALTFGEALIPAVREAVDAAKPMIETAAELAQKFADLDPEQQKNILKWVAIAAVAGPALSALGRIGLGVEALTKLVGTSVVGVGKMIDGLGRLRQSSVGKSVIAGLDTVRLKAWQA